MTRRRAGRYIGLARPFRARGDMGKDAAAQEDWPRSSAQDAFSALFTDGVRHPDSVRFPAYMPYVERLWEVKTLDELAECMRPACIEDGYVLARILGYDSPDWRWDRVHLWLINELQEGWRLHEGGQDALFAPRGTGKTALEIIATVQDILRDPNISIGFGSWKLGVSERITHGVKTQLEKPVLRWLYPEIIPSEKDRRRKAEYKWTESELVVKRAGVAAQDTTLAAFSLQSPAISQHYDIVKLDDVVEAENSSTPESIDAVKRRMQDIRSLRRTPKSRIELRGTMWDSRDFHASIVCAKGSGWKVTRIPVLLEDPEYDGHGKDLFVPAFQVEEASKERWEKVDGYLKTPIFPTVKPLSVIESDLAGQTLLPFTGQMLLRLHAAGGAMWPQPCLYYDPERLEPPFRSYQLVDLAMEQSGQESKRDDSVVTLVHSFPGVEYRIWIWDIFIGLSWTSLAEKLFDNYEQWEAPAIIEEIAAFQAFESTLMNEARQRGKMLPHHSIKSREGGGKIHTRISVCDSFYRRGRIFSRNPAVCETPAQRDAFLKYEDQKQRWPKVSHDDILDTVADACVWALPPPSTGNYAEPAPAKSFWHRHAGL